MLSQKVGVPSFFLLYFLHGILFKESSLSYYKIGIILSIQLQKVFLPENIKTQLILIIPVLHFCKFAYKLKFTCNTKVSTGPAFLVIQGYSQSSEKSESASVHLPSGGCKR